MNLQVLEKKDRYSILLQIYGDLLTEINKRRLEYFYFEDLSLFEIAENENVSRNAIFQSIKIGEKELDRYEEILHIYKNILGINKELDLLTKEDNKDVINKIKEKYLYGI